jgi:hypothetical protein
MRARDFFPLGTSAGFLTQHKRRAEQPVGSVFGVFGDDQRYDFPISKGDTPKEVCG